MLLCHTFLQSNRSWYGSDTQNSLQARDTKDVHEFKPARIGSYYLDDDSKAFGETNFPDCGPAVIEPGQLVIDYPHAGILNTTVFLRRYPTTATNRNRARSRWTYYHFLGEDIEKSAPRTTDPVALADTNNPTMNNPSCTVCHTVMDPVAGAFQNYSDEGWYRDQWGGMDSLDRSYKENPGLQGALLEGRRWTERTTVSWVLPLKSGENIVAVWPEDGFGGISLDRLDVFSMSGELVLRKEFEALPPPVNGESRCGDIQHNNDTGEHDYLWIWGDRFACAVWVDLEIAAGGPHSVEVVGWSHTNDDPSRIENHIEHGKVKLALNPYQEGDTWYRDMRQPGFANLVAPSADNSVQWLAEQVVADERFAAAAVKFWWPAIMGTEVAEPPEDESDADFEGLLLASNAQAAEVTRLADGFRSGFHDRSPYNLKDLLAEIVLSQWFRAESLSENDPMRAIGLGGTGARRLLTPEELARKTLALTGFQWGRNRGHNWRAPHERNLSLLTDQRSGYGLLYGGIDSDGITERARDLTSAMAGVAQSHALQSSYPIVMREFYLLPDEDRLLFSGVDRNVLPVTEFSDTFEITAASRSEIETLRLEGHLTAGTINISLAFLNDFWDEDLGDRDVLLDRLTVRRNAEVIHQLEMEEQEHPDCGHIEQNAFHLSGSGFNCVLNVPVDIPSDATYQVEILAWADQAGGELARLAVVIESDTKRSAGANRIKAKIVELFDKLHGIHITADSPEVQDVYALFVEVWERKRGAYGDHFRWNEENIRIAWRSDGHFLDGIADDLWREDLDENGNELGWDWDAIGDFFDEIDWSDPHAVARTWTVVLAYLMMDYRYLYL